MRPLSGQQIELRHGDYSATIATVGASLRELRFAGRDLVVPFAANEIRPAFRGAILAPWPNRVVDGRYRFDGVDYQLPLTEPQRRHALHGLVAWNRWQAIRHDAASVTLATDIVPSDGYPFDLHLDASYSLDATGLTTVVEATNTGGAVAPYGTGPHPYLVAGPGRVDDWALEFSASEYVEVTDDRLIPIGAKPIADRPTFDFSKPRQIGATFIDHAFTGLLPDESGRSHVTVIAGDGRGVRMSWSQMPWLQLHTADQPSPELDRLGLAVEPMTCPPNAFASTIDLIRLAPGATHRADWLIAAV